MDNPMTDADLLELLELAIADSIDLDWQPMTGALSCLYALREAGVEFKEMVK